MSTFSENSRDTASSSPIPTVLLVDDDITHRTAIAFDFQRKGFRILVAESGNEAWRIVQSEKVNLVVADIRMANGNGIELLNRIREKYPAFPPVILITAYTELGLDGAKDWGAEAVFHKPFDRKALLLASKTAIASQGF